jgi:hypothetical protein
MFQRHKLEKEEGKSYNEKGVKLPLFNFYLLVLRSIKVSDDMKALNRRFGMLHGISSLANLGSVLALAFHGLWLGNSGI